MTKQEIIKKWEKEIEELRGLLGNYQDEKLSKTKHLWLREINSISSCLADLKKLNEAAVSKVDLCDCSQWHLQSINGMTYKICDKCGCVVAQITKRY